MTNFLNILLGTPVSTEQLSLLKSINYKKKLPFALKWIEFILDGRWKENNMNKHHFILDKKYYVKKKLLLSEECPLH